MFVRIYNDACEFGKCACMCSSFVIYFFVSIKKIFQLSPPHFKFHIDPNSKKIHLHFKIFSFQFSNFNLELSEPSPNLPRSYSVPTP